MTIGQNIAHYKIIQKLGEPAGRQAGAKLANSLFKGEL
jgi:hypothetical protein